MIDALTKAGEFVVLVYAIIPVLCIGYGVVRLLATAAKKLTQF
jgi:hypothetical protein